LQRLLMLVRGFLRLRHARCRVLALLSGGGSLPEQRERLL